MHPTDAAAYSWHPTTAPHITARERDEVDRVARAQAQAQAAGITGLRDALLANA